MGIKLLHVAATETSSVPQGDLMLTPPRDRYDAKEVE